MSHPVDYTQEEWASWFARARIHTRVTPGLTEDLRCSTGAVTTALVATAAANLVDLDDDIVAGEFLALFVHSPDGRIAVDTIVRDLSDMAQDLLQVIVEARARDAELPPR